MRSRKNYHLCNPSTIESNVCSLVKYPTIKHFHSLFFQKFDKLLLLASGEVIYFGNVHTSTDYFASNGFECPMHFNPADYILELVTDNFTSEDESMQDKQEIKAKLIQAWKTHSILPAFETDVNAGAVEIKKSSINDDGEEKEIATISHSSMIDINSRWHTSWFEQFLILFVRAYKHRRGHLWSKVQAIQLFCVGFFLGLVWFQIPSTEDNLQDWYEMHDVNIQIYCIFIRMFVWLLKGLVQIISFKCMLDFQ